MGRPEPIKPVTLPSGKLVYRIKVDVQPGPDGKRRQVQRSFPTEKAAKTALAKIRTEVAGGKFVPRDTITMQRQFTEWLAGKRRIRPSTRQGYEDVTIRFLREYGDTPIQRISKADLDTYIAGMIAEGRKPTTIRALIVAIRQPLELAVRQQRISVNPAALVEIPTITATMPEAWTDAQATKFLKHVRKDRLYACWMLTMAGLRRGEVLGLRWSDIDTDAGTLTISRNRVLVNSVTVEGDPKTQRGFRTLPLWPDLVRALTALRRTQATERLAWGGWEGGELLAVMLDGQPVKPRTYSDWFKDHAEAAGLPKIPLKNARHTSVTMMRQRAVPDHVVAAWHGHDETVMRAVYTRTDSSSMAAAAVAVQRRSTSRS